MSSLVCDLHPLRSHPGHIIAASADGGLARWDIRRVKPGCPLVTYAVGGSTNMFCATRRCGIDAYGETYVGMDTGQHVAAVRGRPGSGKDLERITLWDIRNGREMWSYEKSVVSAGAGAGGGPGPGGECFPAVAVEVGCPKMPTVRVWASGHRTLRVFVPDQLIEGCRGYPSFSRLSTSNHQ